MDRRSGVARGVQAAAGHRGEAAVLEATEAAPDPEVRAQAVQVVVPVPGDPAAVQAVEDPEGADRVEEVLAVAGPEGVDRAVADLVVADQAAADQAAEDPVVAQAVVVRVEVGRVGNQCTNV